MALISVISHCGETAVRLETALQGHGHEIRLVADSSVSMHGERMSGQETGRKPDQSTALFIVDLDCDPIEATRSVRMLGEDPSTALTPVLVAASPESYRDVALACAYGASGVLRKPFSTVETVPDTERAMAAASPAE